MDDYKKYYFAAVPMAKMVPFGELVLRFFIFEEELCLVSLNYSFLCFAFMFQHRKSCSSARKIEVQIIQVVRWKRLSRITATLTEDLRYRRK